MSANSNIAWTDHTVNFWIGCDEVSPACDNCYARELAEKYGWAKWGPKEPRHRTAPSTWEKPGQWHRGAKRQLYSAEGLARNLRVFPNSLSDFFDNKVDPEWRADAWRVIKATPLLDWQILTKRPQNIKKFLPPDWGVGYPNVWLGVTAENQTEYDRRWFELMLIPAMVHFVSYEPALGPLIPGSYLKPDWIICGGESGPKRRDFDIAWAETLADFCDANDIAFFFKQDTSFRPGIRGRASDRLWGTRNFPKTFPPHMRLL